MLTRLLPLPPLENKQSCCFKCCFLRTISCPSNAFRRCFSLLLLLRVERTVVTYRCSPRGEGIWHICTAVTHHPSAARRRHRPPTRQPRRAASLPTIAFEAAGGTEGLRLLPPNGKPLTAATRRRQWPQRIATPRHFCSRCSTETPRAARQRRPFSAAVLLLGTSTPRPSVSGK